MLPDRDWRFTETRRVVAIEQSGDLMKRIAFAPALPDYRPLALAVIDPGFLLHGNTPTANADSSVLHRTVESARDLRASWKRTFARRASDIDRFRIAVHIAPSGFDDR
jgi:hypothetical protein